MESSTANSKAAVYNCVKLKQYFVKLDNVTVVVGGKKLSNSKQPKMVQLIVRMVGSVGEWGLVELQGQLETRDQVSFNDMHIGDLHFDKKGTPNLIIGHHLLTGKIVELEKPYAVLKKKSMLSGGNGLEPIPVPDERIETLECDFGEAATTTTKYEVVALITKKIIFKNRPKPIITKTLPRKL